MESVTYNEINSSRVSELIDNHKSFEIVGLSGRMASAVSTIENIIESKNLSCRI